MHVFISYSHADGDFAEILRSRLKGDGFDVWTDEDKLLAGEDWRNSIDQAIRSACAHTGDGAGGRGDQGSGGGASPDRGPA